MQFERSMVRIAYRRIVLYASDVFVCPCDCAALGMALYDRAYCAAVALPRIVERNRYTSFFLAA